MNLRRRLLGLNHLVTLDRGFFGWLLGFFLGSLTGVFGRRLWFLGFFRVLFGDLVSDGGGFLGALNSCLMNLRRRLLGFNHLVTLDGTHTTDSLGLLLDLWLCRLGFLTCLCERLGFALLLDLGFFGRFGFLGYLVSDRRRFLSALDSCLMNLRRRLLGLNHLVTLDRTHTTDSLGLLLGVVGR